MASKPTETLLIALPKEDFAGICETFCEECGQLRLWLRREYPKTCGGCGAANPMVGNVNGILLKRLHDEWSTKH